MKGKVAETARGRNELAKWQLGQSRVFPSYTTPGLCLWAERALCKCKSRFLESKDMAFGDPRDIGSRGGEPVSSVSMGEPLTCLVFGFNLWKTRISYNPTGCSRMGKTSPSPWSTPGPAPASSPTTTVLLWTESSCNLSKGVGQKVTKHRSYQGPCSFSHTRLQSMGKTREPSLSFVFSCMK